MKGEGGVTQCIIDELHSSGIQGDQMEDESGVTRSVIDKLHATDIEQDQMERESGITRVSLMKFLLRISNEIEWKVKVVSLEV